jgi:hypothetical protein
VTRDQRAGAVCADHRAGLDHRAVREPRPRAVVNVFDLGDRDTVPHGARHERVLQDRGQRGSLQHDQRLAQRVDDPVVMRTTQPSAGAPTHRTGSNAATGVAHGVTEPDLVERGKCVGPDADPGATGCVGALFDNDHVESASLQRDCGRKAGDARTHHHDLSRHGHDCTFKA